MPASPAAPAGQRLLFVSYSHKDKSRFAQEFHGYLRLMVRNTPDLGFDEKDVFFDERDILAGDEWEREILGALEGSSALVFLVSANALLSAYCLDPELRKAVERGIPIIPVLLEKCPWEGQVLPGHAQRLTLGKLQAVPVRAEGKSGGIVPVSTWRPRSEAWTEAVTQIARTLGEKCRAAARNAQAGASAATLPLPPLLPFLCGQAQAVEDFDRGTQHWQPSGKSALVVLIKGAARDAPHQFWEGLRHARLGTLAEGHGYRLLEARPLDWPAAVATAGADAGLREGVHRALLAAVGAAPQELGGGAEALTSRLLALRGVLPLVAELPEEPPEAASARLRALLELLESTPAAAPLGRLAIAVVAQHAPPSDDPALAQCLGLLHHAGSRVVELSRLADITPGDVPDWYGRHELHRHTDLKADPLARQVFDGDDRLGLAEFDRRLRRVLQRRERG